MSRLGRKALPLLLALVLCGCTTTRLTEPSQTATQQLLITAAVDDAVAKLRPSLPTNARVFVDSSYFDAAPPETVPFRLYTIGAVRDELLQQGARLADDKKSADIVLELRTGGQSIDHHSVLVGIPGFNIPIPLSNSPLSFPELALYKRDRQTGIAKLAITAYGASSGALAGSSGPQFGASDHTAFTVLLFFNWIENTIEPEELKDRTH